MNNIEIIQKTTDELLQLSKQKGFLTTDEIVDAASISNLPIDDLDRICDTLLSKGVILLDNDQDKASSNLQADANIYLSGRSKVDYEKLFEQVIKIDDSLEYYINALKRIPPPRKGEEQELIYQAKKGNNYARERLILMFLKVSIRFALYYHNKYGFHLSDSIQDANLGLLLAIDKMPSISEYRFSSYAPFWMRQIMFRYNNSFCNQFYLPSHLKTKLYKLVDILNENDCENINISCLPNSEEYIKAISTIISESTKTTEYYMSLLEPIFSLENYKDRLLYSDNGSFMDSVIDAIMQTQLNSAIEEALLILKEKNSKVIKERYGIVSRKPKTLEEVGKIFKLTREGIRQLESKAIKKLSLSKYSEKLKSYY